MYSLSELVDDTDDCKITGSQKRCILRGVRRKRKGYRERKGKGKMGREIYDVYTIAAKLVMEEMQICFP